MCCREASRGKVSDGKSGWAVNVSLISPVLDGLLMLSAPLLKTHPQFGWISSSLPYALLLFSPTDETLTPVEKRSSAARPHHHPATPTSGKGSGGWKLEGSSRPPTTVGGALDLGRAVHAWRWSKQIWDGEITFKATYSLHAGKG